MLSDGCQNGRARLEPPPGPRAEQEGQPPTCEHCPCQEKGQRQDCRPGDEAEAGGHVEASEQTERNGEESTWNSHQT